MHDGNTFRTTGHFGLIKNMDLEELKQLDCGEGETIPTLHELINLTRGKIRLNCEIKARNIAEKIIKTIEEAEIIDTTIISSFKHDELLKIQKLEPRIKLASLEPTRTGWIKSWLSRKKLQNVAINNRFYAINPFYKLVNRKFIIKAHKNNIRIFPWTVDTENSIKKLVEIGVDGIITNNISKVRKILNELF